MTTAEMRKAGRPRSEASRRSILDAALALAHANGYAAATIDAIVLAAGVGKQTIYRWWPSRARVFIDAIREVAAERIAIPDEGSLERDLRLFLGQTFATGDSTNGVAEVLRGLMAEAVLDPEVAGLLRASLLDARRAALRSVFEQAKRRGELRRAFDIELGIDLAFGVLWYRLLVGHAPLDARSAAKLADAIARSAVAGVRRATHLRPLKAC